MRSAAQTAMTAIRSAASSSAASEKDGGISTCKKFRCAILGTYLLNIESSDITIIKGHMRRLEMSHQKYVFLNKDTIRNNFAIIKFFLFSFDTTFRVDARNLTNEIYFHICDAIEKRVFLPIVLLRP